MVLTTARQDLHHNTLQVRLLGSGAFGYVFRKAVKNVDSNDRRSRFFSFRGIFGIQRLFGSGLVAVVSIRFCTWS